MEENINGGKRDSDNLEYAREANWQDMMAVDKFVIGYDPQESMYRILISNEKNFRVLFKINPFVLFNLFFIITEQVDRIKDPEDRRRQTELFFEFWEKIFKKTEIYNEKINNYINSEDEAWLKKNLGEA